MTTCTFMYGSPQNFALGNVLESGKAGQIPEDTLSWFDTDGRVLAAALLTTDPQVTDEEEEPKITELSIGAPVSVMEWSEPMLETGVASQPVSPSGDWVAPVSVAGQPLGVIVKWSQTTVVSSDKDSVRASMSGGQALSLGELAKALVKAESTPGTTHAIWDARASGWFTLTGTQVQAVSPAAASVQSGPIEIAQLLPFLQSRWGTEAQAPVVQDIAEDKAPLTGAMTFLVGLVLVLAGIAFIVARPRKWHVVEEISAGDGGQSLGPRAGARTGVRTGAEVGETPRSLFLEHRPWTGVRSSATKESADRWSLTRYFPALGAHPHSPDILHRQARRDSGTAAGESAGESTKESGNQEGKQGT
ncbi:MAG: hypothetical protein Q4G30_01385 [Actinomycetaceae bacterium]|nr:hypothetical protein [Actinomycetaceae bacterium]